MEAKADYVFELSWEVCNKVGGIYTVLMSKAIRMLDYYKNYILIGPFLYIQQFNGAGN
jgi:phosphorylase/glycogen(starch) synthase